MTTLPNTRTPKTLTHKWVPADETADAELTLSNAELSAELSAALSDANAIWGLAE